MAIGNSRWGRAVRLPWLCMWLALLALPLGTVARAVENSAPFRIGMLAEPGSGNTVAGLNLLKEAFAGVLGREVEFLVAQGYPALIDAQVSSRIDYAVYSASAYALARERCDCVEPIVAPLDEDGSTGIRSILVTRNGALASASDLDGRRIALLPPESLAGHQLPLASLLYEGRALSGEEGFFVQAESAEAAEAMLAQGQVDAMFGWELAGSGEAGKGAEGGTLARLVAAGIERSELGVVWRSEILRYGPHAVSSSLDPETKGRLAAFLTGLKEARPNLYETLETHHLGGFVPVSEADYDPALAVVRMLAAKP